MISAEYFIYTLVTAIFAFVLFVLQQSKIDSGVEDPEGLIETFTLLKFAEENLGQELVLRFIPGFLLEKKLPVNSKSGIFAQVEKYYGFQLGNVFTYESFKGQKKQKKISSFKKVIRFLFFPPFWIFIVSPLISGVFIYEEVKEREFFGDNKIFEKHSVTLLTHPFARNEVMTWIFGFIASLVIFISILRVSLANMISTALQIILLIQVLALIVLGIKLIGKQIKWKRRWLEILDIIIQRSSLQKDFGVQNTALIFKQVIRRYNDIPMSELQGSILVLFAVLQFLVPKIVVFLKLKDLHILY